MSAEEERIVAWLRSEAQLAMWRGETCADDMATEYGFAAEAFATAANAIESGAHLSALDQEARP